MWSLIDYFNDPHLVLKIQNYFGVFRKSEKKFPGKDENSSTKLRRRKSKTESTPSSDENDVQSVYSSDSEVESEDFVVTNKFWYYLFTFGTILGDELFYAMFIPFWFWNVDGAVGRRFVMVWAVVMYIGQGTKDILRWPRPACPPVIRVQKKWSLEYGMPSTHAMVGVAIPFSVLLYTADRYQYNIWIGLLISVVWCSVVCISRLYLGMHSVADLIGGLVLVFLLMVPLIPLEDALDPWILTSDWSPFVVFISAVSLVILSPKSDKWTPTRGDTTVIIGVTTGIQMASWLNYKMGFMKESLLQPPYTIIWPSYQMFGQMLFRAAIGYCCTIATRAILRWSSYMTMCALLQLDPESMKNRDVANKRQTIVELSYKFITYFAIGINTVWLQPNTFRLIGIERPSFYTEI
ncbi:sphingosine-1-phosphate phosphatase 1-like [Neocloeon triangulifer]|uniref:sphingosine-1-phosphate phosphatase 1-like n=1 Tax=Neocloeon triangulifer TaxID=2078957 RepID=UPI00286F33D1|nr:sphingosine-1-phosphate phosphatase 1-like [Neocloeon triangulifer]